MLNALNAVLEKFFLCIIVFSPVELRFELG